MFDFYNFLLFASKFFGCFFAFGLMFLLIVLVYFGIAALIKLCVRKSKKGSD